ncbi:Prefoldin domain-containing protein [Dioscorea alata]|uniref:Prefoldin domain-containing protein n=1 Tax=Dioscorea alata TaxID=55571 RepID=A0ACB7U927_DIOAL|nr:Prefoldin domain-containing protein [Dioscorea alata]
MQSHKKWSDLMRNEGNGGWRTVECLRGRLLAERVASKAAKAQVEQLSTKLDELEKLIAKEIESRDRAERRLKNALKKLESLKLFDVSGSSVSSSSECVSLRKHDLGKLESRQSDGEEVSGISSIDSSIQSGSQEGSWSSVGTGHSHTKEEPSHVSRQQHNSVKELKAAEDQTKYEDNSLALVPSNMWINSNAMKPEMRNDAQEVLRALRRVKQQLQNSVDQRRAVVSSSKELYGQ